MPESENPLMVHWPYIYTNVLDIRINFNLSTCYDWSTFLDENEIGNCKMLQFSDSQ